MNILVDAQPLLGPATGIARYVKSIGELMQEDPHIQATFWINRLVKSIHLDAGWPVHNNRYPYKLIRRFMKPNLLYDLPVDAFARTKYDLFHGTNFTIQPIRKRCSVVSIHDLAFLRNPNTTSAKIYAHHSKWVPYSAQRAERVIAISEQTKEDIVELLHIPESKVDVIHLAADKKFKPVPSEAVRDTICKYNLPESYFLFVGTLEPRKNLLGLLQSFNQLKKTFHSEAKLVIVGAKGWKFDPIFQYVQEHGLQQEICFTGFIADEDLPAIYTGALAFVFPSWYEGFGIPLLEAMGCGVPVIASNASSIPEVVGDNGILLPPDAFEEWADAMRQFEIDSRHRDSYIEKSLERATRFGWEQTYEKTKSTYRKALGGNR
ncbi:glycosyltransferase family 4 protein [Paenibacillus antri]|uniref:Glycosyltransferase family 4 protein n=1 Tax=Paenibacillus antri TaxID=2582848 RepID=A0A5R9G8G6_9BACL|nr:glycosyltransferase family 1 protein [Paenibacillus antri]TLS52011.1 glycosyltransferase family 4 protein [Paenibacillus antri]